MSFPDSGPKPPYSNIPLNTASFAPQTHEISSIDRGFQTKVTVKTEHKYVPGQLVRFSIPLQLGMQQLNGMSAIVVTVPDEFSFFVNVDSREFDPSDDIFSFQIAQVTAIGTYAPNDPISTGREVPDDQLYPPGSFRNE